MWLEIETNEKLIPYVSDLKLEEFMEEAYIFSTPNKGLNELIALAFMVDAQEKYWRSIFKLRKYTMLNYIVRIVKDGNLKYRYMLDEPGLPIY